MQFIRLVKTIDIAERVLPELVADCADTKSMQRINIIVVLHLWEHMVVSWVIEWLNSALPHQRTSRNSTHWVWAICDLYNHDLFRTIPDPGSQQRSTLSRESICVIPIQARASAVNMPKLSQYRSNCIMPCFINAYGTFHERWDQSDEKLRAFLGVRRISIPILQIVSYCCQAC